MSARIPVGYADIHFKFRLTGDPEVMISSLGIALAEDPDFAALADAVDAAGEEFAPILTNQYTVGPHVIEVGTTVDSFPLDTAGTGTPGASSTDATPQNTAYLVRKGTGTAGRRGRGRMFIPGVPEGSVNGVGVLLTTPLADLQVAVNTVAALLTADSNVVGLVLFHETAPFTPTPIITLQAQPLVATQRRRLRR